MGNAIQADAFFYNPEDEGVTLEQASELLPRLVGFVDDQSLYSEPTFAFLKSNRNGAPKAVGRHSTLAEWHKFWGITKSTSLVGTPAFEGGDVFKRSLEDPGSLTPADFRLAKGSAGQGVLPGGKDLGADVDLVGPGEAYERWKKTPEYQEWRKKTDALMAEARKSPLEKLSRDKIPPHELRALGGGDAAKAPAEIVAVLGDSRLRHWHNVHDLAYSPDGKSIASVGGDRALRVWDAATGEQRLAGNLSNSGVAVAWSRNGSWIATGEWENGRIRIWDARTCEGLIDLQQRHKSHVRALAFSPDNQWLASASQDGTVCLWEAETGKHVATFSEHGKPVQCLAFSPDSKRIASGGDDNRVFVWTVADRNLVHTFAKHTKAVRSVAFRDDGKRIASGSDDATARVWGAETGADVCVVECHESCAGVAFQPGSARLAVRDVPGIILWDPETRKQEKQLHSFPSGKLAFSLDGKSLATTSVVGIRLWDVATGKNLVVLDSPLHRNRVSFQSDGKYLAVAGEYRAQSPMKDLASLEKRIPLPDGVGDLFCVAFSPRLLAGADSAGVIHVLEAPGLEKRQTLKHTAGWINCIAFTPDSKRLASASHDKTAIIWDTDLGSKLHTLTHKHQVHAVAFSPDGRQLVTGAGDWEWYDTYAQGEGEVKVWDAQTGKEALTLEGGPTGKVWGVAWSRDGKWIAAAGGDKTVKLWDAATGKAVRTFAGHKAGVRWVLFRHDSKTLLSVDADGLLLEWDGATGNVLRRWQFPGTIAHLDLAADGRHLATANFNGTVYILRLEPDPAQAVIFEPKAEPKEPLAKKVELPPAKKLTPEQEDEVKTLVSRGNVAGRQNMLTEAVRLATEALTIDTRSVPAYILRSTAYDALGRFDKSIEDATMGLMLDADNVQLYVNRTNAYVNTEQYEKAIADATRLFEVNPNYKNAPRARANRGVAYAALGEYEKALHDFDNAVKDLPVAQIYWHRSFVHLRLDNKSEAEADRKRAIQLDATYVDQSPPTWWKNGEKK